MANSKDPDQTAPIGAVFSWSTLFASILNLSVMLGNFCSKQHFQVHFFLGPFRVSPFSQYSGHLPIIICKIIPL